MKPVDKIIQNDLLHLIIGEYVTENERQLHWLPARSGGLGIPVFSEKTEVDFDNSVYITVPLVALIFTQEEIIITPNNEIISKQIATIKRYNSNQLSENIIRIKSEFLPDMKREMLQTKEKGASSWLTVIPIQEHGFTLTKSEFSDAF